MTRSRDTASIIPTVDAKGDLLVGTANNEIDNLSPGTNGQFLTANSATATGLEWKTVSATAPVTYNSATQAIGLSDSFIGQTVRTYANASARTTDIPSPTEGMHTYLQDSDRLEFWNGSAWVQPTLPTGGTSLQILQKSSGSDYAASWVTRASATGTSSPSLILSTSWTTHITLTITCSGRPVFVNWNAFYWNGNSGAMRSVGFRAQLDGVTIGISPSGINIPNPETDFKSEGILVTPTAGSRTFTFQGICGTASACILNSASLVVYEI
jgi:hypothetical protein